MARKRYWLLKCEPGAYSIDDLERDGRTSWEGVRNFQARNMLRDELQVGDGVLFYASNAEPSGVTGIAEVVRAGYPDPFATRRGHKYYDPESDPANPTWYMVDVGFVEKFPGIVSLATLKETPGLAAMRVVQKGSRLSVQPVTAAEFEIVLRLGRAAGGGDRAGEGAAAAAPAGKGKAGGRAKGKAQSKGKATGKAQGRARVAARSMPKGRKAGA